jgi:voltage-dependent calcium channel L type alpha-1D
VSVIRTFRVLRPLKSVAGLEGVKMVLVAVTNSIPELMSVIVLLIFVFAIFGILGLQFFVGLSHTRCRLTPFPVTIDWVQGLNYSDYMCLPGGRQMNFNKVFHQQWTQDSSVWHQKQNCYWPIDPSDERLCSLSGVITFLPSLFFFFSVHVLLGVM